MLEGNVIQEESLFRQPQYFEIRRSPYSVTPNARASPSLTKRLRQARIGNYPHTPEIKTGEGN